MTNGDQTSLAGEQGRTENITVLGYSQPTTIFFPIHRKQNYRISIHRRKRRLDKRLWSIPSDEFWNQRLALTDVETLPVLEDRMRPIYYRKMRKYKFSMQAEKNGYSGYKEYGF